MNVAVDEAVIRVWRGLDYHRNGTCATCLRSHDDGGHALSVGGRNVDSLVCVECFNGVHGRVAPNFRRSSKKLRQQVEEARGVAH